MDVTTIAMNMFPGIASFFTQDPVIAGARVVLMSHLGKVDWKKLKKGEKTQEDIDGQMKKNDLCICVAPLTKHISDAMGHDVKVAKQRSLARARLLLLVFFTHFFASFFSLFF